MCYIKYIKLNVIACFLEKYKKQGKVLNVFAHLVQI